MFNLRIQDRSDQKMHYFNNQLNHCETDWIDKKPDLVRFQVNTKNSLTGHDLELFLCNNVWTEYDPHVQEGFHENCGGFAVNKTKFVFQYCILCGEERAETSALKEMRLCSWESPIVCYRKACIHIILDLSEDKQTSGLIKAIFDRNAEAIKSYLMVASPVPFKICSYSPKKVSFSDEARTYFCFGEKMLHQKTTSPSTLNPEIVGFLYLDMVAEKYFYDKEDYSKVNLFLKNNPWTECNLIYALDGMADYYKGFVFRDCIFCGENRFKEDIIPEHPLRCDEIQCMEKMERLQSLTSNSGKALFAAILKRHADLGRYAEPSYPYFTSSLDTLETTTPESLQPEKIRFSYPCNHQNHRYCNLELFLKNNPWKEYKHVAGYGYSNNSLEYLYQNCIACGTDRLRGRGLFRAECDAMESPITCKERKCEKVFEDLRLGGGKAFDLYLAIVRKDIAALKEQLRKTEYYSRENK